MEREADGLENGNLYWDHDWYKRDEWSKLIWQVSDWDVTMYLGCLP